MRKFFSFASLPISISSCSENTLPIGLWGVFRIRTFVLSEHASRSSLMSSFQSADDTFEWLAAAGGRKGT